jgi:hypothetical protein
MAEPATAEAENDDTETPEEPSPDTDTDSDDDVDMVQTDIEETGVDPDGFFDGVDAETSRGGTDDDDIFDGLDGDGSSTSSGGSDSQSTSRSSRSTSLASDINSGVARAAVIGLDDEWETDDGETKQKSDLEDEFRETFEAFRLGHYASICAEEYLKLDQDDINPVWGLLGASLICAAVIVYRRPDGDQLIDSAKLNLGEMSLSDLTTSEDE